MGSIEQELENLEIEAETGRPPSSRGPDPKRIVMFLDGTWNEPGSNTKSLTFGMHSVWRICSMVADVGEDGKQQVVYYEEGVGTGMFDKIGGGLFGLGIDHYIARAYEYLMQTYEDGDEIFIFGFSRGAFMCRSLMGIIDECGLLRPGTTLKVSQLYDRYRAGANGNPPATLSQILKNRNSYDMATHYVEYMLGQYSRHVAALGIPILSIKGVSSDTMKFNKIELSHSLEYGRHALAVDEHRYGFRPTLWTHENQYYNRDDTSKSLDQSMLPDDLGHYHLVIEQRWFCGAHTNVGGGYNNDTFQQITMNWIIEGAVDRGLTFRADQALVGVEALKSPIVNSLSQFMFGLYQWIPVMGAPYYRPIGVCEDPARLNVHETIDASVFQRWQVDLTYRPKNLAAWAKRLGINLDDGPPITRSARTGIPMIGNRRNSLHRGTSWQDLGEKEIEFLVEQRKQLIKRRHMSLSIQPAAAAVETVAAPPCRVSLSATERQPRSRKNSVTGNRRRSNSRHSRTLSVTSVKAINGNEADFEFTEAETEDKCEDLDDPESKKTSKVWSNRALGGLSGDRKKTLVAKTPWKEQALPDTGISASEKNGLILDVSAGRGLEKRESIPE
ncbi:hypothetical protein PBRA_003695 [Plasmodiophora brassicae]|uniref:T6SS Phospholipase effector Tle1-like catalytic domain-containing protein n=1 Tax=Plasmodiophora brassicae TaxID=37360 RepID=A0A0G4IIH1_PLABS|nr:hypothetical protein PBRA_003695 [Plasmodiophora brassicae]